MGDEIHPRRPSQADDPSTREDNSPEAVERRRKAREEILEKGRLMEERRRAQRGNSGSGKSFDDLVDQDGRLIDEKSAAITSTATELNNNEEGLRKRNVENEGLAAGTRMADPFSDESFVGSPSSASSATVEKPTEESKEVVEPPASETVSQQAQPALLINTEAAPNLTSEPLVDLTPTNSVAPSSSFRTDLSELSDDGPEDIRPIPEQQPVSYWSVNEWAENTTASFYTPPQSEAAALGEATGSTGTALEAHNDAVSQQGNESDLDFVSDAGEGTHTPSSWTEVGSVVSEYD